jgi:hypothetical protein
MSQELLPFILNRLHNESYRISALVFIKEVSISLDQSHVDFSADLSAIFDEISTFFKKSHRPLLIQSLQCCLSLLKRYNTIIDPLKMLSDLRHLLEEMDIQIFTLALSVVTIIIRVSSPRALAMNYIKSDYVPKIINSIEFNPHLLNLDTLQELCNALTVSRGPVEVDFCLNALDKIMHEEKYSKTVTLVIHEQIVAHNSI